MVNLVSVSIYKYLRHIYRYAWQMLVQKQPPGCRKFPGGIYQDV